MAKQVYEIIRYHSADNNPGVLYTHDSIEAARAQMLNIAKQWHDNVDNIALEVYLNRVDADAGSYSMSLVIKSKLKIHMGNR